MLVKKNIWIAILVIAVFSSCGTNKKLKSAMAQNDQLKAQNSQLQSNVNDLKKQVSDLTATNTSITNEFNQYKTNCQQTERKLQAIRASLQEQFATLQQVEKRIEEALADFRNRGVEVFYKDGLVFVEMEDNLLYATSSSKLSEQGKKALGTLSTVLNDYPKLPVIVMGNTDDVQFKKGSSDNWSLSTERANGVVRCMRDEYKVDPTRLTSAGRGKYNPVGDNSTAEGRAKNRRTDIILNPDIQRIWQNVQEQQNQQ
jgi:chemotaxis protein MotB